MKVPSWEPIWCDAIVYTRHSPNAESGLATRSSASEEGVIQVNVFIFELSIRCFWILAFIFLKCDDLFWIGR